MEKLKFDNKGNLITKKVNYKIRHNDYWQMEIKEAIDNHIVSLKSLFF